MWFYFISLSNAQLTIPMHMAQTAIKSDFQCRKLCKKSHLFSTELKFSSGIMFANPKLIPVRKVIIIRWWWFEYFPQRVCLCLQERLLLETLWHTLYTGAERRAAPKLPGFCNWLEENPTSLFVMWTSGFIVWYTLTDDSARHETTFALSFLLATLLCTNTCMEIHQ